MRVSGSRRNDNPMIHRAVPNPVVTEGVVWERLAAQIKTTLQNPKCFRDIFVGPWDRYVPSQSFMHATFSRRYPDHS